MKAIEPVLSLSLKNILLATDFSPGSEAAVKYAQAIARCHSSHVHTIHVSGPDSYQLLDHRAFALTFNDIDDSSADVTQLLQGLVQGLPTGVPLHPGRIWEVINDVIVRNEVDLLVLNTHGRTGMHRLISGSIAEELFRNVTCPVLTIGPGVKACGTKTFAFRNILLATDLDPNSAAPQYAAWLANDFHARLTILSVDTGKNRSTRAQMESRLQAVIADSGDPWCKPNFVVEYGVPAVQILKVAHEQQPDLIVLGARHPEPASINSHLPWATAARVIAEAQSPVLTVRERDQSLAI